MATLLHRMLQNIRYRLEAISPTCTDICGKSLQYMDPASIDQRDGSALERCFTVAWLERGPDLAITDRSEIDSKHKALVTVAYWAGQGWDRANEIIAQDQFDIAQAMRDDTKYTGFADDSTGATGIIGRYVDGITVNRDDDDIWMLEVTLSVHMREQA